VRRTSGATATNPRNARSHRSSVCVKRTSWFLRREHFEGIERSTARPRASAPCARAVHPISAIEARTWRRESSARRGTRGLRCSRCSDGLPKAPSKSRFSRCACLWAGGHKVHESGVTIAASSRAAI